MRRFIPVLLCILLLTPITFALTALDAAGIYAYEKGVYTPAYIPDALGYDMAEPLFSEGLAAVKSNGLWGYASTDGKFIVEPAYDTAGRFSYGFAPVSRDGSYFYIDVTGETVIDAADYDYIYPFANGYARVEQDTLIGFLDARGEIAVAAIYEDAFDVSEGLIAARLDGKWGYLSTAGKTVIPFAYDYATPFSGGVAYVEKGGGGMLINTSGTVVAPVVYSALRDGLALTKGAGGWGFVDAAGEISIECVWQDVELPSEGFIGVSVEGKWGFADYSGAIVIDPKWDFVWPFSDGAAMVGTLSADLRTVGEYAFIDTRGKQLGDASFKNARPFSGGLAAVSNGVNWGYIDTSGKLVIDYLYAYAADFDADSGYALVGRDGVFYVIDKTGSALSFYTKGSSSLLTTAASPTSPTAGAPAANAAPVYTRDEFLSLIVLSFAGLLILFVIVSASMRAYHIRKARKARQAASSPRPARRGRYDHDDD